MGCATSSSPYLPHPRYFAKAVDTARSSRPWWCFSHERDPLSPLLVLSGRRPLRPARRLVHHADALV